MHGCDVDIHQNKTTFLHGIDMYSYNGANFLAFNEHQQIWDARDDAARKTKDKWDQVQILREYTMAYLKNECVNWLTKFLSYEKKNEIIGMYCRLFAQEFIILIEAKWLCWY